MKAVIRLLNWPYSTTPAVSIKGRSNNKYTFHRDRKRKGYCLIPDKATPGPEATIITDREYFNRVIADILMSPSRDRNRLTILPEILPDDLSSPASPAITAPRQGSESVPLPDSDPTLSPPETDTPQETDDHAETPETEDQQPESGSAGLAEEANDEGVEGESGGASPEDGAEEEPAAANLDDLSDDELRQTAKETGIPGYSRMKRETLIARLSAKDE